MTRVTRLIIIAAALSLSTLLSGCGVLNQFFPPTPTPVPTATRTPIPLPTATLTVRPTVPPPTVPPTTAPAPKAVAPTTAPAPKAAVPTQAAAPKAAGVPSISNFTSRFTGRAIEGSFQVSGETVNYIYRIQRVDVVGNRLQFTGTIDYTRANGQSGSVPGLTALLTTQGDSCEQVTLDTQPVALPDWGLTLPAQSLTYNLADLQGNANSAISAVCQLARTVQANPNNPVVSFLLGQINRQLGQ